MTKTEIDAFQKKFFARAGENLRTFAKMMDVTDDTCFYIKDAEGRIVVINRRNREICNIPSERYAIGKTSRDLFPTEKAESYSSLDEEVLRTGKPITGRATALPADDSHRLMINDVFPVRDARGRIIGTTRVYRLTMSVTARTDTSSHLQPAVDFIRKNYRDPIRLDHLAKLVKMSVSTFKNRFSAAFKMPVTRYILITRLNAARRMLEESDGLVGEIARRTGFYDASHFCRVFTAERGQSPSDYRREHRRKINGGE